MSNLELWNKVQKTDPKNTKKMGFGAKLTAIDAYSQIMAATEHFGPYGDAWGLTMVTYELVEGTTLMLVQAEFKTPHGKFPVNTSINIKTKNGVDDDFAKKAETDLITKALSRLGFNADVFLGKFDDQKYVNDVTQEFKKAAPQPKVISKAQAIELADRVRVVAADIDAMLKNYKVDAIAELNEQQFTDAIHKLKDRPMVEQPAVTEDDIP